MAKRQPQMIVALDVDTFEAAQALVERLGTTVDIYKVGSQLFTTCGPGIVRWLLQSGKKVFLDLKFHDIPNTVANAVSAAVRLSEGGEGILMCTLHTLGGEEMMRKAADSAVKTALACGVKRPLLVGITVLTSDAKGDNIPAIVLERARLARQAGLDGVVASSQEAAIVRKEFGPEFVIVTPGIRPEGEASGDQKRVATPSEAVSNGSDFLVVGRPIVKALDPCEAAKRILDSIKQISNDTRG